MNNAIKFVKEMIRKEKAANKTQSKHLREDYKKSVRRDRRELAFYCKCRGISIEEVYKVATGEKGA